MQYNTDYSNMTASQEKTETKQTHQFLTDDYNFKKRERREHQNKIVRKKGTRICTSKKA